MSTPANAFASNALPSELRAAETTRLDLNQRPLEVSGSLRHPPNYVAWEHTVAAALLLKK